LSSIVIPEECEKWIKLHRTHLKDPKEYARDVAEDFRQIEPYLPATVDSILDVGCGMAGIDVLLKKKYPEAKLYLLDGDGEDWGAGWNSTFKPFSSRDAAETLLAANGFYVDGWYDIDTKETLKADLIVSLLSMGWHYPIENYKLDYKTLICDIRNGRGQLRVKISENNKGARWTS